MSAYTQALLSTPRARAIVACLTVVVFAAGCAGQRQHREGVDLMRAGQVNEGLAKLAEASAAAPDNLRYRSDLVRHREPTVGRLLAMANGERAAGHGAAARALYTQILLIDPDNARARHGLEALEMDARHEAAVADAAQLLKADDWASARARIRSVLLENPRHGRALALARQINEREAKERHADPVLKPQFTKPVTLQFRDANLKMVFEALSRTSGINVLLDRDVPPDLKTSIFVRDVSVEDTIDLILLQNRLEKKVISDNTVFVYPSTPAKIKDYQDLKVRSFHLTHADPKQILTMLKTLLKTRDVFIHEKTNSIVMRDTPDAIRLAEKMIADQDIAEPEVMLEVEVLEVSRSRLSELGIRWPTSFTVSTPGTADGVLTWGELKDLTVDELLVSPLSATLNLKLQDTDTNTLASPRIRVRNREKAKIMIGSRVPVITNAVTPVSTGAPVVTGSVQYLDVGLKLEVEPDINLDSEVVIKVGLEVSSIIRQVTNTNNESGTLAYEVGTRNATTVLRLKDGQTQILAGLISDEDRKTAAKVPGLGQIPVVGRLFANHEDNDEKTEIVLSITPRIVAGHDLHDAAEVEYWSGTETSLRSAPFVMRPLGSVALSTTASRTTPAATAPRRAGVRADAPVAPAAAAVLPATPVALSWLGPQQVKVGDTVTLTLSAQSAQPVAAMGLLVSFDPRVLKPIDVVEGDFLKQNDTQTTFSKSIDAAGGQISADVAGLGTEGVSGAGSVVTLSFEAIAASPQSQIAVGRLAPTLPGGEEVTVSLPAPHGLRIEP